MKSRNILLGVLLILLGSLWFLDNINILNFQWGALIAGFFDLWPLILIVVGINLLIKNKRVKTIIWVLFLIIFIGYSFFFQGNAFIETPHSIQENQVYTTEFQEGVTKGKIDLDIGGAGFAIDAGTSKFLELSSTQSLEYKVNTDASTQNVSISNPHKWGDFVEDYPEPFLDLKINESVPWDFDIDAGAIDGNLDFKDVNIEKFNLDLGAGRAEIILGEKSPNANINIEAGASQVIIHVPNDCGIRVNFEGGLNANNLSELGLIKQDENSYISKNYQKALSKYNINVEMGLGDFKVYYYVE